jgi:ATP synthase protein I
MRGNDKLPYLLINGSIIMKEEKSKTIGLLHIGAGNMFASMILSGFIIGYFVDQWLDKTPIFMLIFAVIGFIGGMIRVHEMISYENKESDKNDP